MSSKFRKKPVVIEAEVYDSATQLTGAFLHDCDCYVSLNGDLIIITLEGDMRVSPGDYIIRGIKGEFYPCKPDIFAATYEAVT